MNTVPLRRVVRVALRGAVSCAAALTCIAVLAAGALLATGHRPVVIQTGSMGETAPPGSLIVARPVADVAIGDVLVMRTHGRATITHRIVDLEQRLDGLVAVTRGDANPDIDPEPYVLSDRELVARWVVPDAGRWLMQIRDPLIGLTLLIGVVGTLTFLALRRIWAPPATTPPTPGTIPAPPPVRQPASLRRVWQSETGRRRRALVIAATVGATAVLSGAAFSLYLGVDSVAANSFATRPCYDARLGSVQTGHHVNNVNGTSTESITAVDPDTSFLLFSTSSASNEPDETVVAGRLASSTTLEFIRNTDDVAPGDIVVEWAVVEYDCGVSVQRGVATTGGTAGVDVPISAIDPASSFALLSQGAEAGTGTFGAGNVAAVSLVDATTLRLEAGAAVNAAVPLAWQVVTFDGGDISTQQLTASFTATDSTVNVPIPTTVDPASTAVFTSVRFNGGGLDVGDRLLRSRLIDGGTVELSRSVANETLDVVVQVVEFVDGTTVRHGVLDLAPAESLATVSIPPVQPSRSTVTSTVMLAGGLSGGSTTHVADDVAGEGSGRFLLTDARTVEVRRDATASSASFPFQVITWNGPNWADLDAPFRQRIDVTGGSVVTPTGYTTPLTIDHTRLVADGLSLGDGSDLRIWRHDGVAWSELHRVLDDDSAWDDPATTIWFRTQESIAVHDTATYWLYFGDDAPNPPLADPAQVWLAVEGFDDGTLGVFEDRTGGTAWYDDDPWERMIAVDVDGTGLAASVTDVPVLVRITDPDVTAHAQADGDDVRFTAADTTTPLPHVIEDWDPSSDTLTAWVRVPTVAAGTTTRINLHYGSASAPSQTDARSTFAGAIATWFLAADPAVDRPALDDEGPGQRDGVALADAAAASTPAGPGIAVDGALDRLESQPFAVPDDRLTISLWFRADTLAADVTLMAQGDPAAGGVFEIGVDSGTSEATALLATTDGMVAVSGGTISPGTWHHIALSWDRADLRLYLDGTLVDTRPTTGALARVAPVPVVIGADPAGSDALDGVIGHAELDGRTWPAAHVELIADLFSGARITPLAATATTRFEQGTWDSRWPIVVDAASVAGTLSDDPLLVALTDASLAAAARPDGADLVFTASDATTRLDHWVEHWDDSTGELVAWVRIPTLEGSVDTTLYLYAGNASAVDQGAPEAVWGPDVDLVVTGPS